MSPATTIGLALLAIAAVAEGFPSNNGYYNPYQRSMMFSGYYSNPLFGRSHSFNPQGAMSAFVTRDAVATNTYAGNPPILELPLDQKASEVFEGEHRVSNRDNEVVKGVEEVSGASEELATEPAIVTEVPKRVGRKKIVKKPPPVAVEEADEDEEEEEEEEEAVPVSKRRGLPATRIYFPISISGGGGGGGARRRASGATAEDDYYLPGAATAIANSYSTGKGGIATSHATSFGDPYLVSQLLRNGLLNGNKSNRKGQEIEA